MLTNAAIDIAMAAVAVMGEVNIIAINRRPTCMCRGSMRRMAMVVTATATVMVAMATGIPGATADITMDIILVVTTAVITLEDIMAGTISYKLFTLPDCQLHAGQ